MRKFYSLPVNDLPQFKAQLLLWSAQFSHCCYLDSNNYQASPINYQCIVGVDAQQLLIAANDSFEQLKQFYTTHNDWLFGYLSYNLKDELEDLRSSSSDKLQFPLLQFFIPRYVFIIKQQQVEVGISEDSTNAEAEAYGLFNKIMKYKNGEAITFASEVPSKIKLQATLNKLEYIKRVNLLKQHIQDGNCYEINFCQEFFAENVEVSPIEVYKKLNAISEAPFAAFCRFKDKYALCSSPERFLCKQKDKLISQPIKGTARRGLTATEDEQLKLQLHCSAKEQNENVMIVDLVRNDLSRTAVRNSVQVEELFGIYTFKQVHQLISTISSRLSPAHHFIDAIKYAFPMGSMTGAPKVSAMKLIDNYETTSRGLYSGAIGYITPQGDFDFNVVIRTILYNEKNKYLSFMTGSAITSKCNAEQEYEECLVKAKALINVINNII